MLYRLSSPPQDLQGKINVSFLGTDRIISQAVTSALAKTSFELTHLHDVVQLVATLRRDRFRVLLLEDCEQELLNWLALLQIHNLADLPIVVIGPGHKGAICRALLHGAHDYVVLSEGAHALSARLQAQVTLRMHTKKPAVLSFAGCSLHAETRRLQCGQDTVTLTGREFALAWIFFDNADRVVPLNALSMQVWGKSSDISKRTVEQHVYKLRRKLSECVSAEARIQIQTIYGVGYRLHAPFCAHDHAAAAESFAWVI